MITLIPSWTHHYDEFWKALRARNLWFIKLRYGAAGVLGILMLTIELLVGFTFSPDQETAIIIITSSILLYNILLHWVRRFITCEPDKFNPLHLSIIQIILDLAALMLLLYFTGTIESPLLMLFIFHMIIGSLILPGVVIYSTAFLIVAVVVLIVYLEYNGLIFHHSINGFLEYPLYQNYQYITSTVGIFAFVIIISVLLANRIAKQLYKMEQQLVESLDKLEAAEIEKQKYIIGVVHEIKTPLTALHSFLDLVLERFLGPIDNKVEEKLIRARQRSTEAIQMINNVLKISRLRLLNDIVKEKVDPGEIICEIISKHKVNVQNKGVSINNVDKRAEKKKIMADSFLLEIAFSNLIGNALKYSSDEGIIIVEISDLPESVKISICDNGIGIPPEDLTRIFEDFYRASNIKHKNLEGTGLGLSIVKKIIDSHSGNISVQSPSVIGTPEKPGACFTLTIPY